MKNFVASVKPVLPEIHQAMTSAFADLNNHSLEELAGYKTRTKTNIIRDNFFRHIKELLPNISISLIEKDCEVIEMNGKLKTDVLFYMKVKKVNETTFLASGWKTKSFLNFENQTIPIEGEGFSTTESIYIGFIPDPLYISFDLWFIKTIKTSSILWRISYDDIMNDNIPEENPELFTPISPVAKPKIVKSKDSKEKGNAEN